MRRVPRFRGHALVEPGLVVVADHGRALAALRPVAAGGVHVAGDEAAVGLRAGEHVVLVRRVAPAVDDRPALGEGGLLGEAVGAVQLLHVCGDHVALRVLPRATADALARVDAGHVGRRLLAQVGAPCAAAGACGRGERLAVSVGAGQAAQVGAVARPAAGDEKAHAGFAAAPGHAAASGEARRGERGDGQNTNGQAGGVRWAHGVSPVEFEGAGSGATAARA